MKHSDWTPFRLEEITDADVAVKKRKYSPSEAKQQMDQACSRMRVNLGLTFTSFPALRERLGMKSSSELACFLLCRYKQYKYMLRYLWCLEFGRRGLI